MMIKLSQKKCCKIQYKFIYYFQLTVHGHHFTAQQFYTVIHCNNCHQIIYGISPQGYQCTGTFI